MPNRRARLRRRIYNILPKWLRENDFEILASVMCLISGLPLVLGRVKPRSIEALLPPPVVTIWGILLTLGGLLVLVGIAFEARTNFPRKADWLRVKALGLSCLAYACYVYMVCVLGVQPKSGSVVAALLLTFGGICHIREAGIHIRLEQFRQSIGVEEK